MKKINLFFLVIMLFIIGGATIGFYFYKITTEENLLSCPGCNVLIIAFDAEQAKHVSSLGYSKLTTPTQDALAKKGFLFTNAIAQSSWTIPSFMSFFTSLYPSEHKLTNKFIEFSKDKKVINNFKNISPDKTTMAEVFKINGYQTAGFTGDAGVGAQFGYNKGFNVYVDSATPFAGFETSIPPALEWLKTNKDNKFFMFLHSYGDHGQYDPPIGYSKEFLDFNYAGPLKGGKEEQARLREEGLAKGELNLTEADYKFWRALYDEKIYNSDKQVGDFLKEFDKLGLSKNTIIIALADHGTEIGEHKKFDHGSTLYDELINVPLIIKFPNNISKIINSQVRAIDLMPTIIEALGLKIDEKVKNQMQGQSLISIMDGNETFGLDAFSETDYRNYTHKKSLRTVDGWKFIYTFENNQKELYNIKSDPGETDNLMEKEPRIAYELEQKLFDYIKNTGQDISLLKNTGCLPVYGEFCTEKLVK
ncbi:MAG: sulfatase [bacterium]